MTAATEPLYLDVEPDTGASGDLERVAVERPADVMTLAIDYMPRSLIHPDPAQPRSYADAELRASIKAEGILQPLTVRYVPQDGTPPQADVFSSTCACCGRPWSEIAAAGEYLIVFGERRWRGSEGVQDRLPVIVRLDKEDRVDRLITQLVENSARPLPPLDDARALRFILTERPTMSQSMLAARLGRKRSSVTDRLALLRNAAWLPLLESGEISVSQMVELSRYADRDEQEHRHAIEHMRGYTDAKALHAVSLIEFRDEVRLAYPEPAKPENEQQGLDWDQGPEAFRNSATPVEIDRPIADVEGGENEFATDDDDERGFEDPQIPDVDDESDSEPADHATETADSTRGTAPAVPSPAVRENPLPGGEASSDQATDTATSSELPATAPTSPSRTEVTMRAPRVATRGLFQMLAAVLGKRPAMITLGPAAIEGQYRLTISPVPGGKGNASLLTSPVILDGTPEELDEEAPAAIGKFITAGGAAAAASSTQTSAPAASENVDVGMAAHTRPKRSDARRAAKKAAKKAAKSPATPAKKPAPRPAKKVVAKKPVAKKVATPATKPKKGLLYPDAALTIVLGDLRLTHVPIKLPAVVKKVLAYVKTEKLAGTGGTKGLISCDANLRVLFGTPIVKANQLQKLLKSHLSTTPGAPSVVANGMLPDTAVVKDPAQLSIEDSLSIAGGTEE